MGEMLKLVYVTAKMFGWTLQFVAENKRANGAVQYGLSFILPEKTVLSLFDKLSRLRDPVKDSLTKVTEEVDLILSADQKTAVDLLSDALRSLKYQHYKECIGLFDKCRVKATKAFHTSRTMDDWVACTQLKITAAFFSKSCDKSSGLRSFGDLDPLRQMEIAETLKADVEKLLAKRSGLQRHLMESAASKRLKKKGQIWATTREEIQAAEDCADRILRQTYPILSQGLGWTKPHSTTLELHPEFLPEGREDSACLLLPTTTLLTSSRPVVVTLCRDIDYPGYDMSMKDTRVLYRINRSPEWFALRTMSEPVCEINLTGEDLNRAEELGGVLPCEEIPPLLFALSSNYHFDGQEQGFAGHHFPIGDFTGPSENADLYTTTTDDITTTDGGGWKVQQSNYPHSLQLQPFRQQ